MKKKLNLQEKSKKTYITTVFGIRAYVSFRRQSFFHGSMLSFLAASSTYSF